MVKLVKVYREYVIFAILIIVFFFAYSFLAHNSPTFFSSPDESLNYFFIEQLNENKQLVYKTELSEKGFNLVRPRSTSFYLNAITPGSFTGFIIYINLFTKIFGLSAAVFIIPFLSAITPVFFYYILQLFFSKRISLYSSFALYFHPAFWYYSTKSMMHNMMFIDLLIMSFGLLAVLILKKNVLSKKAHISLSILSGMACGGAIMIRPNEITWIFFLMVGFLYLFRKSFSARDGLIFLVGMLGAMIPVLYINHIYLGNALYSGYTDVFLESVSSSTQGTNIFYEKVLYMYSLFFPFGIHIKAALKHAYYYLGYLFWWFMPLVLLSCAICLTLYKTHSNYIKKYIGALTLLSLYLVIYYGSWKFTDNPDPKAISIGTSYIRYWMPLFVLSLPLFVYSLEYVYKKCVQRSKVLNIIFFTLIFSMISYSGYYVLWASNESFTKIHKTLTFEEKRIERVIHSTPENAVIIVDYDDKYIFPHREVMIPFRQDYIIDQAVEVINFAPVYYYGLTFPEKDMIFLNTKRLFTRGLDIQPIQTFTDKTLYQLTKLSP